MWRSICFAGLYLCIASSFAAALTLHVSPDGNNGWSGRIERPNAEGTDGPLASLAGARDAIRRLKAAGPLAEAAHVLIADGEYPLTEPLVLTPQDSGTADCPITYEAAAGAHPVFSGGREIGGWRDAGDGLWVTEVPEVAAGQWYFEQLFVNGRRAVRARTPNGVRQGETYVPRYLYVARKVGYGLDPATGQVVDLSSRAFFARPDDGTLLQALPQDELNDVTLVAYHAWESSRHRLQSADPASGQVVTTGPAPWPFGWLGPSQRYHLENYLAALDEPGEWFLSRAGTLHYRPLPDEDMATARVVAPVATSFVEITGDPALGTYVEHVALRGLTFEYSGYILPPEGHGDGQAAVGIPAVIMVDDARSVAIEDCRVAHTGTYGVWFRRGCADCRIERSELFDLGAGGVRIGEILIAPNESERTQRIVCDNNIIHGGGRLFTGAVGVWVGQSGDNQVTHNDISDLFYTGISVGWSWGYADTLSKRNTIDYNHIHHLGWGVMSDMGGVYTLGISDGTTVSHNVIHDIYSYNRYGYGGLGLYNDEGTTHITMEDNLVYDTLDMTYHQHYGRENVVRNNILVDGRNFQISVHRPEEHLSATFEHNIVYFHTGKLFWQAAREGRQLEFRDNVYWNAAGEPFDFMGMSLAEWQASGLDAGSVIADPLFADPANLDFTLSPDSPAPALGFVPFDWREAGVYGDADRVALAHSLTYPPVEPTPDPPPAPPLVVDDGFEDYPLGARPPDVELHVEGKGDEVAVTSEAAAGGTQSLKLTDAEGLQFSFDPHIVYRPDYTRDSVVCGFDIRVNEGAQVWHEYRDWTAPNYITGPSLQIIDGKLMSRDRELMDVPTGEWFRIDVLAPLGDQATGQWQLTVTVPGQGRREFTDLAVADPGWNRVNWIGFVSNAERDTAFFIDNVRIANAALAPLP